MILSNVAYYKNYSIAQLKGIRCLQCCEIQLNCWHVDAKWNLDAIENWELDSDICPEKASGLCVTDLWTQSLLAGSKTCPSLQRKAPLILAFSYFFTFSPPFPSSHTVAPLCALPPHSAHSRACFLCRLLYCLESVVLFFHGQFLLLCLRLNTSSPEIISALPFTLRLLPFSLSPVTNTPSTFLILSLLLFLSSLQSSLPLFFPLSLPLLWKYFIHFLKKFSMYCTIKSNVF